MEQIYTLQEAAEILRLPYRLVRDEVYRGAWPHIHVSQRRRLMSESDLAAVVAGLHRDPLPVESASTTRQRKATVRRLLEG